MLWKIYSLEHNLHDESKSPRSGFKLGPRLNFKDKDKELLVHDKGVYFKNGRLEEVFYEGAYFNTLSTNLQVQINEFLRRNVIFEDLVNGLYFISLNREIYKYIQFLRTIMDGFPGNYDLDLEKMKLEI